MLIEKTLRLRPNVGLHDRGVRASSGTCVGFSVQTSVSNFCAWDIPRRSTSSVTYLSSVSLHASRRGQPTCVGVKTSPSVKKRCQVISM